MKRNNTLLVLFVLFIVIIIAIFFVNRWLEGEIQKDASDQKTIQPAKIVGKKVTNKVENLEVKEEETEISSPETVSEFEKKFMEEKDAVYETPTEDVILLQ